MSRIAVQFVEHDRRIFWGLSAVLAFFLALYVYFLGVSVFAVIARKGAEQSTLALTAKISQEEAQYVALNKKVDLALAHERGFLDITVPQYVTLGNAEKSISMRGAE